MIVPGTTISLTLLPTSIEVRDKGLIKKKIPLQSRSFDDIAIEIQKYFRYLNKRLAPGVLENVLTQIGLPKARRVIPEPEPQPEPEPVVDEPSEPKPEPIQEKKTPPKSKEKKVKVKKEKAPEVSPAMSGHESGVINANDFDDIADALQAVEALSDSFMAPSGKEPIKEKEMQKISINLQGEDEIIASGATYARTPGAEIAKSQIEEADTGIVELIAETVAEDIDSSTKIESVVEEEPVAMLTPSHQIKPIVHCKALLLGETGVGKRSLKGKAGIEPKILNEETGEVSPYIYSKIIDGANHRIQLNVWSFDLAVKDKLPRQKFYDDAQLLVIVYAASDRWSFESLDFWLRESSLTCEVTPPIVIVGNKIDLRSESGNDSGEDPVSYNEGFQYAEDLAKRLGGDGPLHPVAFIETSSLTGEKTEEVFETAAHLYENKL
ncbi:MAG: GTP-binding protein [Candidatus Thorarchaeota archaeon]|nr:MAG: GTP-binding protein [Candidatus Thorarchaeota archaeon]